MINVRVKFDMAEAAKTICIDGTALRYPEIGNDWSFQFFRDGVSAQIDLGRIENIKFYDDMYLVQTELIVAEIWVSRAVSRSRPLVKSNDINELIKAKEVARRRDSFRLVK